MCRNLFFLFLISSTCITTITQAYVILGGPLGSSSTTSISSAFNIPKRYRCNGLQRVGRIRQQKSSLQLVPETISALSTATDTILSSTSSLSSSFHQFSSNTLAVSDAFMYQYESIHDTIEASTLSNLGHDILTFLLATVVTIPLSRSLNINPTLSFLLIGCLLGPYNLHLFSNNEADLELGDFGILFLLFNEGLTLSADRIKALTAFSKLGLFQIMSSMALFFFGTLLGGPFILQMLESFIPIDDGLLRPILSNPVQAFLISSAGALSSSAFVLPVLKNKGWASKKEGISGLSILLLQDLAVAPLLVLLPVLAGSGPQSAAEFGVLIIKAVFGFGGVLVAGRYMLKYIFDVVAEAKSTETFVAAAVLVVIAMGQVADILGLSASTGAFAAGVLLAGNKYRPQIQADIKPFEGILLGIFFLTAGAELDPAVVLMEWPTLLVGITAFLITKSLVLFASGPALGLSRAEAARVALTLSGGGEFSFVLFKVAQQLGVLPDPLHKLLTASVIISMALTPVLGDWAEKVGNIVEQLENEGKPPQYIWENMSREEKGLLFDECDTDKNGSIDLEELRTVLIKLNLPINTIAEVFTAFDSNGDNEISRDEWIEGCNAGLLESALSSAADTIATGIDFKSDAIVICGFGQMGRSVYTMLREARRIDGLGDVVAFSLDPSRVTAGVITGAPVVYGDGARSDLLKAAGVTNPKAVLITYASQSRRINALKRLRDTLPEGTIIYVRADSQRETQELFEAGATDVICETTEAVLRFGSLLGAATEGKKVGKSDLRRYLQTGYAEPHDTVVSSDNSMRKFSENELSDIAETVGITTIAITELLELFESLDYTGTGDVPVDELKNILIRMTDEEPVDVERLERLFQSADEDGLGFLNFEKFAKVAASTKLLAASQEPPMW